MDGKPLTIADKQALLRTLAARAAELLAPSLERLYVACQTHFFELASAADSGANRPLYLGFVRDLKRAKATVSTDFGTRLTAEFARLEESAAGGASAMLPAGSAEERLATAARGAASPDLNELYKRLRAVAARTIDTRDVPLDPARVLAAFLDACGTLAQDAAIRDPLCAQFDQHVLRALGGVCRSLVSMLPAAEPVPAKPAPAPAKPAPAMPAPKSKNDETSEWLDAAYHGGTPVPDASGMAPAAAALFGVGRGSATGPAQAGAAAPIAAAAAPVVPAGVGATGIDPIRDLQEISGLLQRLRDVSGSQPGGAGGGPAGAQASVLQPLMGAGGAGSAPAISGDQLVALLSDVQNRGSWRGAPSAVETVDIRGAIQAIAASKGSLSVGQAEQDMVDIVTMFFDLITEDRDLPSTIQALLQRLQLPVLKIALTDRSFLTDRTHPARALIDGIARIGMGWDANSKQEQDSLLAHLNALLEELLAHPALGVEAFRLALHKLNEHSTRVDQRATKQERRTAERAQAEARLTAAREAVHEVLRERVDGRELPQPLLEFFTQDWQRVLQLTWLRQGKDSAQWGDAVRTVEELVQITDTNAPAAAPDEELYKRLEAGLALTQSNTGEAQERVATIRAIHRARIEPPAPGSSVPPVAIARARIELPPPIAVRTPAPPAAPSALANHPKANEALSIESLKRVDEMPVGTWFEYEDPTTRATRRCKLSARIEETRMFLFSDRMGMPVHEKPRKQFAHELQLGVVRVIEDAPLVDRTIGRIAATLRERAGEAT